MQNTEAFSYVLTDSFMSALILPFQEDVAFPSMIMFGNYSPISAIVFASLGAIFATFVNMLLGRALRTVSKDNQGTKSGDNLNKLVFFMQKYGKFGLLFAWFPLLGAVFALIVGFTKIPMKSTILPIVIGCFGYYIYASGLIKLL